MKKITYNNYDYTVIHEKDGGMMSKTTFELNKAFFHPDKNGDGGLEREMFKIFPIQKHCCGLEMEIGFGEDRSVQEIYIHYDKGYDLAAWGEKQKLTDEEREKTDRVIEDYFKSIGYETAHPKGYDAVKKFVEKLAVDAPYFKYCFGIEGE